MPAMCDERERLIGYLYDECDADEKQLVEAHLQSCPTCRDEIAGLQSVRSDLLAWDVPDHGSVWTPFVKARPKPSWRDVPAWTLAAAASLMLAAGATGGALSRVLFAAPAAAVQVAAPSGVTAADLSAAEQRIRGGVQTDLSALESRVKLVSAHAQPASIDEGALMQRVNRLIRSSEQRQLRSVLAVNSDLIEAQKGTQADIEDLRAQ